MTELHAIVYVSTAKHALSNAEIQHLLERSRARNLAEGITGVLLYSKGNFMQYIEGNRSALAKVYEAIKTHPLHYGIIEIISEPRQTREFSEWHMAFRSEPVFGMLESNLQEPLLSSKLSLQVGMSSSSRILLSSFWNRMSVYPQY
jgi:hypothetical protein